MWCVAERTARGGCNKNISNEPLRLILNTGDEKTPIELILRTFGILIINSEEQRREMIEKDKDERAVGLAADMHEVNERRRAEGIIITSVKPSYTWLGGFPNKIHNYPRRDKNT